jgi:hydrogenase-4 component B
MEYTGLSFTQPLTDLFASVLHHRVRQPRMEPIFPAEESFSDETPDLFEDEVYRPMLEGLERLSGLLRRLQHGRVQLYVLYVLITLVGLLAWGQL